VDPKIVPRSDAGYVPEREGHGMTTLDHAGTAGPDTLAASGRLPAGPPPRMPFLLAGMAIGQFDLGRPARRLLASGPVGALIGYRGSWLAVDVLGLCLLSARRVLWPARAGGSR
jgi:hypothetical protein